MEESEPRCCIMDRAPQLAAEEKEMRTEAFRSYAAVEEKTMELQTGYHMQDQWRGDFISKAMPFTIPRLISGPDFFPGERQSAEPQDGLPLRPAMSPTAFLNALARRNEAQCRANWTALPVFRSLWYNFIAYTGHNIMAKVPSRSRGGGRIEVTDHIRAMQRLATALDKGFVGKRVCKVPVGGDLSRLPFAEG